MRLWLWLRSQGIGSHYSELIYSEQYHSLLFSFNKMQLLHCLSLWLIQTMFTDKTFCIYLLVLLPNEFNHVLLPLVITDPYLLSVSLSFSFLVCLYKPKQILPVIPNGVVVSMLAEKLSPAWVQLCCELNSRSLFALNSNYSTIEPTNMWTMKHFILEDGISSIKCSLSI